MKGTLSLETIAEESRFSSGTRRSTAPLAAASAFVFTFAFLFLSLAPGSAAAAAGDPAIEFTHVPAYGSGDDVAGRVTNVDPATHNVVCYVYVSAWYVKPTLASPLTPINPDGSFTCDVTTGGTDQNAARIACFVIPAGGAFPSSNGDADLPDSLYQTSVAEIEVERGRRKVTFSGYEWNVKFREPEIQAGPGPNWFSDTAENVWVDGQGRLHLKITLRDGKWYCAEVFTDRFLGHGKYRFYLSTNPASLDRRVVAGAFTWDGAAREKNYREVDFESSQWDVPANENSQYVVQPFGNPGNMHRFDLDEALSTHSFDWSANRIVFQSLSGHHFDPPDETYVRQTWTYTGADNPPAGTGTARMNLWLYPGAPPSNGQPAEIVVEKFEFTPMPGPWSGAADYDGDHGDEIGVFRNGMWFLSYSPDHAGVDQVAAFGSPVPARDKPEIGEFNCAAAGGGRPDGQTDLAIFRKPTSTWQATLSPDWAGVDLSIVFGTTDHKRIPLRRLDTNGDGCSDIGVFRNGCFDVLESPAYAAVDTHACFGLAAHEPVAAELNGDGRSDLILWRPSSASYAYRLSPDYATGGEAYLGAGDYPLAGDLNGDGLADLGSYKQAFSTFRFSYSPGFSTVDLTKTHGVSGDVPIVSDVNGDGVGDIGIFRNAIARWWFLCSPSWSSTCLSQSFGTTGDIPIYGKPPGMP